MPLLSRRKRLAAAVLGLITASTLAPAAASAADDRSITPAITTGGVPDAGEHPYVGAMHGGRAAGPMCSGTLVSSRVFVTAAHCTDVLLRAGTTVAYVSLDERYTAGRSRLHAARMRQHPLYDPQLGRHDLAVLVLDQPVALRRYGQLPRGGLLEELDARGLLVRQRFEPVGYGAGEGPAFTGGGTRRKTSGWAFDMTEELLALSQRLDLGESGTCVGDSGGPVFVDDSRVVVAVTSYGDKDCRVYGAYSRLDSPSARAFLSRFVTLP